MSGSAFFHISRVIFAKKLENRTVLRYNPLEVRKMNSNKKLYNLFLIFVAVSMLFVSVFGSFSVADTNTEKSEKSDDNYLLSDIPDELSDEPPFDAEAVSEKDAEDYRKWAQRDPRWGQLPMGASGKTVAQIGCLVTSVTKIIIQSGYRTSDTFNVATLVNWLNTNGGLSDSGNLYWYKPAQMIDGLEFEGMEYYAGDSSSAAMQEKIMSYVRQDKHVILTVKNYGHYVAVDNAKSIAEGRVFIMDSLNNVAGNADVALDSRYPYVSRLCIYAGNNPNDSDYISRCSFEMTHLEAQVKSRATLFSLPCDASAGFGSVAVSTASAGEKLVVTGDLVNTLGQSWHQVFVNGSHLYVKQTEIGFVRFLDDIEIQSETIPQGTLPLGRSFALTQTVVSRHSITRIEGRFADGDGDTLMSAAVLPGVHGGFDISGTAVDAALRFGSLAAGHYAYELKAIVTASSSLTSRTETFTEILVCPFSIELEPLRTYTVTFKDGMTREVLSQQNIYYGFSAVEPPLPVHNGYVFYGWSEDFDNVRSNLHVYANFGLPYLIGDADGNGAVEFTDALSILRHSMGISVPGILLAACDVNGDGTVDSVDALMLMRRLLAARAF